MAYSGLFQGGFLFCPLTEGTICLRKEQDAMKRTAMPVNEKYALTITEASRYYNIGIPLHDSVARYCSGLHREVYQKLQWL